MSDIGARNGASGSVDWRWVAATAVSIAMLLAAGWGRTVSIAMADHEKAISMLQSQQAVIEERLRGMEGAVIRIERNLDRLVEYFDVPPLSPSRRVP